MNTQYQVTQPIDLDNHKELNEFYSASITLVDGQDFPTIQGTKQEIIEFFEGQKCPSEDLEEILLELVEL